MGRVVRIDREPPDASEALARRVPPHNTGAEMAMIGAVLLSNTCLDDIADIVNAGDFYRQSHQAIYKAMLELAEASEPIDLVTLTDKLTANGTLSLAGGTAYLMEVVDQTPTTANVRSYAKIVRDNAVLRELITTAAEVSVAGYEAGADVDAFLDYVERKVYDVADRRAAGRAMSMARDVAVESMKRIEALFEKKAGVTGVPTGFIDLDAKLGGLQPTDLVIIAGRPSMGKTAFGMQIALHASAPSQGGWCLMFSLEMSKEQLGVRTITSEARVNTHRLKNGWCSQTELAQLAMAASRLSECDLTIDESGALNLVELRARARRVARTKRDRPGLIMIDYLQLMSGAGSRESREQEIAAISRGLKGLAKELSVPVVALSQLNRQLEQRQDKKPIMSDLRESGAIEQDADTIMFLHRPVVYDRYAVETDALVIVGKQRNGPIGEVPLQFFANHTRFESATRDTFTEEMND